MVHVSSYSPFDCGCRWDGHPSFGPQRIGYRDAAEMSNRHAPATDPPSLGNRVQPDMKDRCAERYLYTLDWILRLGLWADNAATWAHKSVSRLRTTGSSRQCGMGSSPIDTSTFPIRCFWRAELNGFIHTWFDPHCKGWSDLTCTRLPHPPSTLGANGSSAKPVSSCSGINNQGCRTLAGPSALRTGTEGASKDLEVER